jgi:hypothetical protein
MSTTTKKTVAKKPKVAKTKITLVRATTDPIRTAIDETRMALATPWEKDPSRTDLPLPNLLGEECGSGLKITFEGIVGKFTSDFGGSFTYAKRVAMAYAVASRTNSTWTGIGMVDLTKAFEIIAFEPATHHITVKLTEEAKQHSMEFATADLSFLNQPRPSVAAMYGYDNNSRRRSNDW